MGVYIVAMQSKYNSYYRFRMVDSHTGQVKMLLAQDVFRYMANAMKPFKVEHMKIDYAKDTFVLRDLTAVEYADYLIMMSHVVMQQV